MNAIESLMEKKGKFDYILLETTGLADPGNLAPLFWVDDGLGSTIYLDGIVTLVDAKNILRSLDDPAGQIEPSESHPDHHGPLMTTAHVQLSHADVIVLNKADLVTKEELAKVRERIESINGLAKIHVTEKGVVPELEGFLLDLNSYASIEDKDLSGKGHSHLDPVCQAWELSIGWRLIANRGQTISTITIPVPALSSDQVQKIDRWLRSVLWDCELPHFPKAAPFETHRLKGRLVLDNGEVKMIQGVREIFEMIDSPERVDAGASSQGKLVVIGRHLVSEDFAKSLSMALTSN